MKNQNESTRGGAREGAGRPPEYDEAMVPLRAKVPPAFLEKARSLGYGNLGLGIRRLLAESTDLTLSTADIEKIEAGKQQSDD